MNKKRTVLAWIFSSLIAIIPALFFSFPEKIEKFLIGLIKNYPEIKKWGVNIEPKLLLLITFLGVLVFILTSLGRFQEYKIHIDSIPFCRRQLNLFKYFSYMSMGYVFSFFGALYTMFFFKDADVLKLFSSFSVLIFSTVTFLFCFLIVKVFILEEILDLLYLDYDLEIISGDFLNS